MVEVTSSDVARFPIPENKRRTALKNKKEFKPPKEKDEAQDRTNAPDFA